MQGMVPRPTPTNSNNTFTYKPSPTSMDEKRGVLRSRKERRICETRHLFSSFPVHPPPLHTLSRILCRSLGSNRGFLSPSPKYGSVPRKTRRADNGRRTEHYEMQEKSRQSRGPRQNSLLTVFFFCAHFKYWTIKYC